MGLVVILASTVVAMSAVAQLWEEEWEVLLISLQVSEAGWGQGHCLPGPLPQAELPSLLILHTEAQRGAGGVCTADLPASSARKWRQDCLSCG